MQKKANVIIGSLLLCNKPSSDLEQLFIFSSYNCRPADLEGLYTLAQASLGLWGCCLLLRPVSLPMNVPLKALAEAPASSS